MYTYLRTEGVHRCGAVPRTLLRPSEYLGLAHFGRPGFFYIFFAIFEGFFFCSFVV